MTVDQITAKIETWLEANVPQMFLPFLGIVGIATILWVIFK